MAKPLKKVTEPTPREQLAETITTCKVAQERFDEAEQSLERAQSSLSRQRQELPTLQEAVEQAKQAELERRKEAVKAGNRFQPSNAVELAESKVTATKRDIKAGKAVVEDLERELSQAESRLDLAKHHLRQAVNEVVHHDYVDQLLQRFKANLSRTLADANELSWLQSQRIITQGEHVDIFAYLTNTLGSSLNRLLLESTPTKLTKWIKELQSNAYAEIE